MTAVIVAGLILALAAPPAVAFPVAVVLSLVIAWKVTR